MHAQVRLDGKLASAAQHVQMPSPLEGGADGPLSPILVVNLQMPLSKPAAFGFDDSGTEPTFSIIAYFGCSAAAQAEARSDAPSAAVRLMTEYCAKAPRPGQSASGTSTAFPFKIIAKLENIDELGLPSHLARFNGKPALIRKSGTLHAGTPAQSHARPVTRPHGSDARPGSARARQLRLPRARLQALGGLILAWG